MSSSHFHNSVVIFFIPRYGFLPTWHLFLIIFHYFRPKFAPEFVPMPSFGLPWAPLGLIWGTFWIPLDPLWRPLASLLPCQDTSWSQSWSFGTPKSHFGRFFQSFSMIFWWNFNTFSIIFVYSFWGFHFVFSRSELHLKRTSVQATQAGPKTSEITKKITPLEANLGQWEPPNTILERFFIKGWAACAGGV